MALGFNQFAPPTLRGFSAYGGANREPYMSPDQEQSLLSQIGASTWGGIGAIGSFLDVPGGMIRNTLGGENPFTPLANPLSTTDRTPGRDLLVKYSGGIVPENYEGFSPSDPNAWKDLPWDVMGFATEVLLDPLTYLTLGAAAYGKIGKMAKGLGAMDDLARIGAKTGPRMTRMTKKLRQLFDLKDSKIYGHWHDDLIELASKKGIGINELLDAELGSLGKFAGMGFGRGTTAQKVATGLDWMGDKIKYSPPVRYGRAALSRSVLGVSDKVGQIAAEMVGSSADDVAVEMRRALHPTVKKMEERQWFDPHGMFAKGGFKDLDEAYESSIEFGFQFQRRVETGSAVKGVKGFSPDDVALANEYADTWRGFNEKILAKENLEGGSVSEVDDLLTELLIGYSPHQPLNLGKRGSRMGEQLVDVNKPHIKQRGIEITGHKGGIYPLQRISIDPELSGVREMALRRGVEIKDGKLLFGTKNGVKQWTKDHNEVVIKRLKEKYGDNSNFAKGTHPDYTGPEGLFISAIKTTGEGKMKWGSIAKWVSHLPAKHAHNVDNIKGWLRRPAYEANPIEAMIRRHEAGGQVIGALRGIHRFVIDNAGDSGELVSDVYRKIDGIDVDRAMERLAHYAEKTPDEVKKFRLDVDTAANVTQFMKSFTEPEAAAKMMQVYDDFIRTWKGAVTVIWPSFHARNLLSGQLRNMQAGAWSISTVSDARRILQGGVVDDAAAKYAMIRPKNATAWTDEIATEALREELFAHKVLTHHAGMGQEFMGRLGPHSEVVGMSQSEKAGRGVLGGAYSPRPVPGTSAARRWSMIGEGAGLQRYGAGIAYYTEGLNRIAPYLHKRKQGWASKEASELVGMLQVNYERLTDIHKQWIRRIFPFATFQMGVIPWTAKTLLEKPGGMLAQTAKFPARVRSGAPSAPEYINETAAIPLRSDEPGSQKYLATLGLMEEPGYAMAAPLMRMATSPMDAGSDFIREMVGHTTPPIKALYEIGSGRSSFFGGGESGGRPLRTMSPPVGQIMENVRRTAGMPEQRPTPFGMGESQAGRAGEYALGASPASRFLSSGRIATDTRKTFMEKVLNLMSGFKTYDISARQANAIVNENINRRLLDIGGYKFSRTSISDDTLAGMSPDARQEGEQLKMLQSVLQKKMKQ